MPTKGEKIIDVGLSVDGTWQRKVFSSTLGVVAAISIDTGKVLDVSTFQRAVKDVAVWQRLPSLIQSFMKYGSCHKNVI